MDYAKLGLLKVIDSTRLKSLQATLPITSAHPSEINIAPLWNRCCFSFTTTSNCKNGFLITFSTTIATLESKCDQARAIRAEREAEAVSPFSRFPYKKELVQYICYFSSSICLKIFLNYACSYLYSVITKLGRILDFLSSEIIRGHSSGKTKVSRNRNSTRYTRKLERIEEAIYIMERWINKLLSIALGKKHPAYS